MNNEANSIAYTLPLSGQVAPRNKDNDSTPTIYPNPFSSSFTFDALEEGNLEIYDMMGRAVMNISVREGENSVAMEGFDTGMYMYRFSSAGEVLFSGKLLKL